MKKLKRIRDWMEVPGRLETGPRNSITDVPGVMVGHCTLIEGDNIRTGVTMVKPHQGNVFIMRPPAGICAGNGHTKASGSLQIEEMGELESCIALTSTLSVGPAMQGLLDYHKKDMEGCSFKSINLCVMETNDGPLSDIMGGHVRPEHVAQAAANAGLEVQEGGVGAGTGCTCFGYKGGIGTSSRVVRGVNIGEDRDFTVGVMVQANFGGNLNIYGHQLPYSELPTYIDDSPRGSCSIVVATDAPMSDRQLRRLARRAIVGMALTGTPLTNSSGDYAVAFSNYEKNLRNYKEEHIRSIDVLSDNRINLFFEACAEATREAVYNALCMADDMTGIDGHVFKGFNPADYASLLPLKQEE